MYFATITFYVALLCIIGMLVFKRSEIKHGRKYFLSRLADKTDHIVHAAYDKVKFFFSHINKKTAIAFAQWIAFHILSFFHKMYMAIHEKAHRHPHSKKVIDMVTGKGEVKPNGGASFYLKSISEDKKHEAKHEHHDMKLGVTNPGEHKGN